MNNPMRSAVVKGLLEVEQLLVEAGVEPVCEVREASSTIHGVVDFSVVTAYLSNHARDNISNMPKDILLHFDVMPVYTTEVDCFDLLYKIFFRDDPESRWQHDKAVKTAQEIVDYTLGYYRAKV
jgi:hypothetical protein